MIKKSSDSKELGKAHLEVLDELIQSALAKSAKAMEQMLKIRIKPEEVIFGNGKLPPVPEFDQLGRFKVHMVRVTLKGQINGAFYFIINSHEVDLVNQVCLPKNLYAKTLSEDKLMKHGFMSEIENMIAALSIAEISEFLGVQLLSGVPEVQIMAGEDVNDFLAKENENNNTVFHVRSVLSGVVVNISPFYIWMLDDSFLDTLKLNIVS